MAQKCKVHDLDETLSLAECKDGFWLYDTTRGMNLSMRAKTAEAAFFEALKYYQARLLKVEGELKTLSKKVDSFVSSVCPEDDGEE
jgi:hypothetical protein